MYLSIYLDVMHPVWEYLEEGVEEGPGLQAEHLRQQLLHEPLDPKGLQLRVDQQPAVGLNHPRRYGDLSPGVLIFPKYHVFPNPLFYHDPPPPPPQKK